jgi:predicted transposase/invertase (TIGR01784 family)
MPVRTSKSKRAIQSILPPDSRKYTKTRVDVIFKRVFGTEKNKGILRSFLSELLQREIIDLTFENSELQNVLHPSLAQRAAYYCAQLYAGQLKSGDGYEQLRPTLVIFIMDFDLFPLHERPVSTYELRESQTGAVLVPGDQPLELLFIELPKVRKKVDISKDNLKLLDLWLLFLAADDDMTLESLRMKSKGTELDWALSEIEYAALSKKEKLIYNSRLEGERIQRSILSENVAAALAEGKIDVILRKVHRRFGSLPKDLSARLSTLSPDQLDESANLVLDAADLNAFTKALERLGK